MAALTPASNPTTVARRGWSTTVFLLLSLGLVLVVFFPLWKPLLWGAVFAALVSRLHNRTAKRLWNRRYLSATIYTLLAGMLIVAPLTALAIEAVQQAQDAAVLLRNAVGKGGVGALIRALPDSIESWVRQVVPRSMYKLPTADAQTGWWAALQLQNVVSTLSEFAFDLAMMMIAFFFVLADGRRFVTWVAQVSPMGAARTTELIDECRSVARSVIGSNFLTGLTQAAVATAGYLIAQAPKPLFFGLLTLLASFIPSVGTALVSLPLAALLLAAWSLLIVAVVDNLMRPLLIKSDMQIHGAFIFFSLIGGIILFGFTGLLLGPLALGLFTSLVRYHARDVVQTARLASSGKSAEATAA
jgi:predicted PurR-regulated permease PerM